MATFIALTDGRRFNMSHVAMYSKAGDGAVLLFADGSSCAVTETPEQIDAMLGVTESGETIAAELEAEAARMDDDATAIHNMSMRSDMKLRAKAFRDAAKIARTVRGE